MSEIMKSVLECENITKRIDSEYFQKLYLRNIVLIKKNGFFKLKDNIKYLSGGATPLGAEYQKNGIPFLRVQNIMQNYFNLNEIVFINGKQDEEIKRTRLKERDVLLTITGVSYGKSAVVPKELINANINQHSVKITLKESLNPFFVSTFFNSIYGKLQSDKNIVGVTRPALDYEVIRNFNIPCVSATFQNEIEFLINASVKVASNSQNKYTQAESILLETIGLQDFKPSQEPVNIKSFKESFGATKRLDAEYYQPKFEQLTGKIYATNQGRLLGELLDFNQRGKQPEYTDEDGLFVINSKHIRRNKIDFTENRKADMAATPKSLIIKKGDVLLNGTGVGTIGRCAAYLLTEPALPDNHVTILRTKTMNPVFLSVMLNSIIGQMQVDKFFKGSSGQIELYPADINQFVVWNAPEDIQSKIANFVLNAYNLEAQSNQLLDIAKKAVEMAVEENEEKALQFIKNNSEHDRF